ncbi:hypothetical protein OKA05_05090 [Luteolibacter arcticus]|uniref:Uncharacterized protein n=1 Tax=Luteolibacter arcticus TaxID=1581411 RepID=A0ABT3GE67_9BACT|nr:hypothetical protein [Luteolibacter arcticus]MCW1921916.1 hypothetical protein [Luteolibacter arcticus]
MTIPTVDHPRAHPETSLPPLGEGGQVPAEMTAEEHQRWKWETRLRQLVMDETRAWKRLTWGAGIYFGLLLLMPLGVLLAGGWFFDHARPDRSGGARFFGIVLQGIGGASSLLLAIPVLLRFVRWVAAMWRRRRFSSTPGADPGQLLQR